MYKCPNCGGEMEFLPENGKIKCEFCGSVFSPEEEIKGRRKSAVEHKDPEGQFQESTDTDSENPENAEDAYHTVFTCSQCGATLYTPEEAGVTFCSYCGSQAFLESRVKGKDGINPDLIIPFQISKEQCEEIYKTKIKSAWFLPKGMKSDTAIDKFRGIYMPCWVYGGEADIEGDYNTSKTTRAGVYDIIKTYHVRAAGHGTYAGFVRDASSSFPDGIMREIGPYDMNKAKQFNDRYMTGFYADIGNVPSQIYGDEIHKQLDSNVKTDMSSTRELRNYGVKSYDVDLDSDVRVKITDVRKGFFPVWFLSNKNDRTGLMSYAVVNGFTGKIHTDLPIDFKKYLLISLLAAIPAFLILQFFTLKPGTLLLVTMLLLGIMMFFSTKMIRDAYIQEHGLDDEGLLYLQGRNQSAQRKEATVRKKLKFRGVLLGLLCFIGIPFLSAIGTYFLNYNLIVWGFIVGIVLFIVLKTGSAQDRAVVKAGKIKLPFIMTIRSIMFPLIGILVGLAVTIVSPASDLYYYLSAILCCVMLILTVLDFARSTNRLSLRKPAQLGKRGGDEND